MIAHQPQNLYPLSNRLLAENGRVALALGYEGHRYHGWQSQPGDVPSVQAELEKALTNVASQDIAVVCAGRTDAGVNATCQIVHFDTKVARSPYSWVMGTNHFLPDDVAVLWAGGVEDDFHARYSATSRVYRYVIYNHPIRTPWARNGVSWIFKPLDHRLMYESSHYLLGEHDFSAFRSAECQANTPSRRLIDISIERTGDLLVIEVEANAFLHHMVRNIVGTLLMVGMGKKTPQWVAEVLASRNRAMAGATAPASGLYLVKVGYPPRWRIPVLPKGPFFLP